MKRSPEFLLALLFCLLLPQTLLFAQSTTAGNLVGTITDPSDAVIPGAKVTAINDATQDTRSVTSDARGTYHFLLLTPGAYTVNVTASTLRAETGHAEVGVGQSATLNFKMQVTSSNEEVNIKAQDTQLQTADISTLVSIEQLSTMPNPGNDLTAFVQASPGTVMNTQSGYGNFSTFGLPATSNLFTLNGQNDNDPFLNLNNSGPTNLLLGANDVQEVTIVNNGYSGEYGQLAGAQVNYVTKSGGNNFHGNAIYYWNGRALNANDWFNNFSGNPRSFDNVNQWATSLGGPIRKDKTFFFWNYEGIHVVIPTSNPAYVPTQAFETATINNLNTNGLSASVPFYQQMFALYNNAAGAASAVPQTPDTDCTAMWTAAGLPTGTPCRAQFQTTAGNFTQEYVTSLRIDHIISDSDRIFGRVETDRGLQATFTDYINPAFNEASNQPSYQGQMDETHVFNANAVNEFKASGSWYTAVFNNPDPAAAFAAFPTTVGFLDGEFSGLGGQGLIGRGDNGLPSGRSVFQYQLVDDFSLNRGSHNLKFGVNYHRDDVTDYDMASGTTGLLTVSTVEDFFNGGYTPIATVPTGDQLTQTFPNRTSQPIALYSLGFYGQDEWRARKNLKLTFALRLDHNSIPVCQTNCFARMADPFTTEVADNPTLSMEPYNQVLQTGLHSAFQSTDFVVWQPRFGFNWNPAGGKTVVSGGIGVFSDAFPGTIVDNFAENPPNDLTFAPINGPISPAQAGNLSSQANAAATAFKSGFSSGATFASLSTEVPGFAPPVLTSSENKVRQPRYYEWNLEVQRDIGWNTVVAANYVGNHGIYETTQNMGVNAYDSAGFAGLPVAPPDAAFASVNQIINAGTSSYNGLTLGLHHNYSHGLVGQVNYSWSHSLDDVSNAGLLQFNYATNPSITLLTNPNNVRANYGNSDYDVRQYFSMTYSWDNSLRHLFSWGPNVVFSGWTISGTLFSRTGLPFSVVDSALSGGLSNYEITVPNALPGTTFAPAGAITQTASCGEQAAKGTACLVSSTTPGSETGFSTQERNQYRGPGYFDTDLDVFKNFAVPHWEQAKLAVGAQFFNLLNHPNFDQPVADINNPQFGQILHPVNTPTSVLGSFLGGDAAPRLIQFTARVTF